MLLTPFRTLPMARIAVLGGRTLADLARNVVVMAVAAGAAILGNALILFIAVPLHDRGQRASGG